MCPRGSPERAHAREAHTREAYVRGGPTSRGLRRGGLWPEGLWSRSSSPRDPGAAGEAHHRVSNEAFRPISDGSGGRASGTSQTSTQKEPHQLSLPLQSSEPDWRDCPLEKRFEGTCSKEDQSTCLMQLFQSDICLSQTCKKQILEDLPGGPTLLIHP